MPTSTSPIRQISRRDTSRDGWRYRVELFAGTHFPLVWSAVNRVGPVWKIVNPALINNVVNKTSSRPNRLSTKADHTSWESLVDHSYSSRHLPPGRLDPATLPSVDDVVQALFTRSGGPTEAEKSTLLFSIFAQWFTDGFLRTDPDDPLRNTSSHEIDLSQLYGPTPEVTALLRGDDGRLKCEETGIGAYPPRYFEKGAPRPEFAQLPIRGAQDTKDKTDDVHHEERREQHFALGIDRGNLTYGMAMMSTLFLREHNRLCDLLEARNGWKGDRLFDGARAVLTVMLLKIVVEEYINHVSPFRFRFRFQPGIGAREKWYRQNWISIEFNLLYRWHALVPDVVRVGGERRRSDDLRWDMSVVREHELGDLFEEASAQPAGELQLRNTPEFLLAAEHATISAGRAARLASYNDYRRMCGFPAVRSFDQISSDPDVQDALRALYRDVDRIEYYVGLLAEDTAPGGAVGPLMGLLVGIDAFSQALTNPLLSENVYDEATFSGAGLQEIEATRRLADIVARNTARRDHDLVVAMTRQDWRRP